MGDFKNYLSLISITHQMAKIRILKTVDVHVKFKLYWKSVTDIVLVIKRQKVAWQCFNAESSVWINRRILSLINLTYFSQFLLCTQTNLDIELAYGLILILVRNRDTKQTFKGRAASILVRAEVLTDWMLILAPENKDGEQ